ncbi:MAG: LamG domain-containing protein [Nanoarchaeota archaeon]|nr:LamG domain-containing protein [Nanoarchaeota archaeon]
MVNKRKRLIILYIVGLVIITVSAIASFYQTSTQAEWNLGTFTNTSSNSSGSLILTNSSGTNGFADQIGNWTSAVIDLNNSVNFTNMTWFPSFGEIPSPFDEPSSHLRDGNLVFLAHLNNDTGYGEGSNVTFDYSGLGNNGTPINGSIFNVTGKLGGSYNFDGVNDYINFSSGIPAFSNNATVFFWFFANRCDGYPMGVTRAAGTGNDWEISLSIAGNAQCEPYYGGNGAIIVMTPAAHVIPLKVWTQIAVTVDSSNGARLYKNGILINSTNTTTSWRNANGMVYLASRTDGNNFNGSLDEVAFWNRSLSTQEIGELYNRTRYGRVRVQVRSCDDAACSGETYVGQDNNSARFFNNNTFSNISFIAKQRYVQYKLYLDIENATKTVAASAYVDDAELYYEESNVAPSLNGMLLNISNDTLETGDFFNVSVNVSDNNSGDRINLTVVLFVNGNSNQTVSLFNNYRTNQTASYIFNNTNISAEQQIIVQVNGSDGVFATNYLNSTMVGINKESSNSGGGGGMGKAQLYAFNIKSDLQFETYAGSDDYVQIEIENTGEVTMRVQVVIEGLENVITNSSLVVSIPRKGKVNVMMIIKPGVVPGVYKGRLIVNNGWVKRTSNIVITVKTNDEQQEIIQKVQREKKYAAKNNQDVPVQAESERTILIVMGIILGVIIGIGFFVLRKQMIIKRK